MSRYRATRPTVGSLVIGRETRPEVRHRVRAEKRVARELDAAAKDGRRQRLAAEKAVWQGQFLPARGENRVHAGRTLRSERLPRFSATTRTLRTTYPFLAERGLGADGMMLGFDVLSLGAFCFDPWVLYQRGVLTNPNIAVAGVVGTGKSALCKALAVRGRAFGRACYVPGDVKGEWSPVARALGGVVIEVGPGSRHRLNPLDEGSRPARDVWGKLVDDETWREIVARSRADLLVSLISATLERALSPEEHTAVAAALESAVRDSTVPLLGHVAERLLEPRDTDTLPTGVRSSAELAVMGGSAGHALMRMVRGDLAGILDGPSTVPFDTSAPMVTVDLKAVSQQSRALPLIMTCTGAWMESSLRDPDAGKRWVIYEEAHRLMENPALLERMKEQWKLARGWGIANVLVLHRLTDLDAVGDAQSRQRAIAAGLLADTSTRIIHRQESDQIARTIETMGLSQASASIIGGLPRGQALWQVQGHPYLVQHAYTRGELDLFDTDAAMRDPQE